MLKPYATTGIGSLPHTDPEEAVNIVLSSFDIPFWPQLPKLSFLEQMIPQYSEGLPLIRVDWQKNSIMSERGPTEELERFYESYNEKTRIAISEEYAQGLHAFLRLTKGRRFDYLKGHVTGPLTFTLGLNDATGKPVYYDEELREVYLMGLKAKARWQIDLLKSRAGQVIIFVDEPVASALGSMTYLTVSSGEALRLLTEMVSEIKAQGAIAGIHCCGRADWPLLMESGIEILNFDAYEFSDTLGIYPAEVKRFLEGGGTLAWGIIPTTEAITGETEESIYRLFMEKMDRLSQTVPETLLKERILLTPSCGTASRNKEEAIKIFQLLSRLKEALA